MKRRNKRLVLSLCSTTGLLSSCLVLPDYIPNLDAVIANKVELSTYSVSTHVNGTYTISYTFDKPESKETITWKPMDEEIATISQSGTIQAGSQPGNTKILLISSNKERKENLEAAIDVTVISNEDFFMTNENNEIVGVLDKSVTNLSLPEKLNNQKVTTIASDAFKGCDYLTTLNIPNGYENLNDHCFDGLSELTNLLLPASLKNYGVSYGYLKKLKYVYFGSEDRMKSSDNNFVIGDTGNYLYQRGLVYQTSSSVREYAKLLAAWDDLSFIPSFVGDTSVILIEELASGSLYGLDTIKKVLKLPESIRKLNYNFMAYSTISEVVVPANIESVEPGAFANAINLEKISSNDYIQERVNANDILVQDNGVYLVPKLPTEERILLSGCKNTLLNVPFDTIGEYCFEGCNFANTDFLIHSSVKKINKGAFKNNPRLNSVSIPSSVTSIEEEDTDEVIRAYDDSGKVYEQYFYDQEIPKQVGPFYMCNNATLKVTFASNNKPEKFCSTWDKGVKAVLYNQEI